MIGTKKSYSCFYCGEQAVAEVKEEGTVPHVINNCINPTCDGLMKDDFAKVDLVGKKPNYHLVRNPEAPTDKLELKKV